MATRSVFLSHESALRFWRHHDMSGAGGIKRSRVTSTRTGTSVMEDLRRLLRSASPTSGRIFGARTDGSFSSCLVDLNLGEPPLHVMVGTKAMQRRSDNVITHYYATPLPVGSFCSVDEGVYVASPELTLCQLAQSLPYADLLEICLEFCSGYVLNPESERGFDDRPPLTSARRLGAYVERFHGRHGAKKLRRVLPYVIDDSCSPMESHVLMLLCLPTKLGGYQLPLPQHNVDVPISGYARSHNRRDKLPCDLYWKEFHLDVECDSTMYHTSKRQLGVDSNRRIILEAMHYSYVGITAWQLENRDEFIDVVQAIRRAMGLKLRNAPEHVEANREALRRYLTEPQGSRPPLNLISGRSRRGRRTTRRK